MIIISTLVTFSVSTDIVRKVILVSLGTKIRLMRKCLHD